MPQHFGLGGGNLPNGAGNNIFGTLWNSPIWVTANNAFRMAVFAGGTGNADGRVAMSNNLPGTFTPQARLHLMQTGGVVNLLFNNTTIGTGATDGLEIGISPAGDAFFINNELGQNFSWYNRGGGLLGRMRLYDGGVGQGTGRLAISNDLPLIFTPVDRLHLYEVAVTGSVQTRYQNTATGVSTNDGYAVGVNNSNRVVNHTQFEAREMRWLSPDVRTGTIREWLRIQNNVVTGNTCGNTSTDGYLGLNNPNPIFHIDGITPAKCDGELFVGFTSSDVPNSKMGLCNAVTANNALSPTFFGNLDASLNLPAVQTLGAIVTAQDVSPSAANPWPVHRFIVGKDWIFNNNGVQDLAEINNRMAFSWQNGAVIKMQMSANGQTRIGTNLSTTASAPRNRLEISASAIDPYGSVIATNGASGVRLTYLTSAKTPLANGTNGVNSNQVLSVDSAGVIVMVAIPNPAPALGNVCGAAVQNPLPNNWEIPFANFNYVFSDPTAAILNNGVNRVGIGTTCTPGAKFHVVSKRTTNTSPLINASIVEQRDVALNINYVGGATGVYAETNGSNRENYAFYGRSFNASRNVGIRLEQIAAFTSPNINTNNEGVFANAANGVTNIGVQGVAADNIGNPNSTCTGGIFDASGALQQNIGMRCIAPQNGGVSDFAAFIDGDIYFAGTSYGPSDASIKTNIDSIPNIDMIIRNLKPRTFYFDTTSYKASNLSGKKQYGFIAQDVELILPELVTTTHIAAKTDSAGNIITPSYALKSLNYNGLIAVQAAAIKSQQEKIDSLTNALNSKDSIQDARLTALENAITQCCSNANTRTTNNATQTTLNQVDIELSDKDAIVLNQNVPNPFAEQTTITFNVPASVGKAQLIFFNTNGQVIQTVDIKTRGKGKVNVFASDLSSGLYNYSLVADGKVIDSKKMVRE
ncbi:MAG: tail fiber domain-containing protein [Bacteroidota bacterium]